VKLLVTKHLGMLFDVCGSQEPVILSGNQEAVGAPCPSSSDSSTETSTFTTVESGANSMGQQTKSINYSKEKDFPQNNPL
jgi:hypothetical protein